MSVTAFQDLPLADRDRGWDGDAAEKRVRRWAGATDEPRERAPRPDLVQGRAGITLEEREAVSLVRPGDVEQVMRHARAVGRGRLRRADVHAAVHLAAVRVHDFAAQRLREFEGEGGLARGGRPHDGDEPPQDHLAAATIGAN